MTTSLLSNAVSILGLPVGAFTKAGLLREMEHLTETRDCSVACGINAYSANLACSRPDYRRTLQSADLLYADGSSILLAARVLGERLPAKLATPDLWDGACELAVRRGLRVFLLGGEPGLAERVAQDTVARHPRLRIAGTHHGFFDPADESVVERINASGADIVWVGMGEPRQARWAEAVRHRLRARLVMTCGAMFSVLMGDVRRLPPWWCAHGFEWIYRLAQQPGLWRRYLVGLPLFGLRVLKQRLFGRPRRVPGTLVHGMPGPLRRHP